MKILIAVPTFDTKIDVDVSKAIYDLIIPEGVTTTLEHFTGYDCARARNKISAKAIDKGYDYVFMVDSDVVLPEDALVKLLSDNKKIVFGIYPRKYEDTVECIRIHPTIPWDIFTVEESRFDDTIEVKACGFGCALIDTSVFSHINYPFFKYEDFGNGDILSEDFYFCERARAAGFPIYANFSVKCKHKGVLTKEI